MFCFFFFQAEDGIRDLVRSRGLGDVYKRQSQRGAGVAGAGCGHNGRALLLRFHQDQRAGAILELSLIHI